MDIQQNGTTYIKLHPSTTYGYARPPSYASSRVSVHKQDANNFYTVAAFYCTKLDSKLKNDMDHYVHIGVKMFGSGGFSNAVGVSETGVAKFSKIAPGSDGFSEKDFYRDLITELRICLHAPVDAHENIIQFYNIQWTAGLNVSNSEKFDLKRRHAP
ncbi:hypothetical protein DFP73DRAFT_275642 [Morchella snyderi]|nr:hypothetical protein DFP73DRAFT_275642 [Morchella snyderi]